MKSPCYECHDRHIDHEGRTCYSTCGRYKLYRLMMDKKCEEKLRHTVSEADFINYKKKILHETKGRRRR